MTRSISAIAVDIAAIWKPSVHAKPYLHAMHSLQCITDCYYLDSGRSIVLYFLANARGFRGAEAQKLKAELNFHLKGN